MKRLLGTAPDHHPYKLSTQPLLPSHTCAWESVLEGKLGKKAQYQSSLEAERSDLGFSERLSLCSKFRRGRWKLRRALDGDFPATHQSQHIQPLSLDSHSTEQKLLQRKSQEGDSRFAQCPLQSRALQGHVQDIACPVPRVGRAQRCHCGSGCASIRGHPGQDRTPCWQQLSAGAFATASLSRSNMSTHHLGGKQHSCLEATPALSQKLRQSQLSQLCARAACCFDSIPSLGLPACLLHVHRSIPWGKERNPIYRNM